MTTATAPRGPTIIANAENAASGAPPVFCTPGCQPCTRVGWTFLAVAPGVVPKEFEADLDSAGYRWPTPLLDSRFASLPREGTLPVARILRQGYVYVIFPARQRADVWEISAVGLARKLMHQVDMKQYGEQVGFIGTAPAKMCSRGAANVPASLIHVEHAKEVAEVWVGYSPHILLKSTFRRFLANELGASRSPDGRIVRKPLRELHGRTLSPSAILGKQLPPNTLPINESALRVVADFTPNPSRRFKEAFKLCGKPLDEARAGMGESFTATVRGLERANSPAGNKSLYVDTSLIVMLDDAIGVMADHNTFRLAAAEAKRLWSIGGEGIGQKADPTRIWAVRSSLHLDMVLEWERATAEQRITQTVREAMERRHGPNVTQEQFDARNARGGYPAGSTFEPIYETAWKDGQRVERLDADGNRIPVIVPSRRDLDATTIKGRVRLEDGLVKERADAHGASKAQGARGRLEGRVDMGAVRAFRAAYEEESNRWDERILKLDRDFVQWRKGATFSEAYLNLFEHEIRLTRPDPAQGAVDQQLANFAARLGSIEVAVGGGAVSIESMRDLVRIYELPSSDPHKWFDGEMFSKAFNLKDDIYSDAGNATETGEATSGLSTLRDEIRRGLAQRREQYRLESTVNSILAARMQMVNIIASAVDKQTAERLGIATVSAAEAERAYRVHMRVSLLGDDLLRVDHGTRLDQKLVFTMKVPVGLALDQMREGMNRAVLPLSLKSKSETSRAERRFAEKQFRNLEGRVNAEMSYPVLLEKADFDRMRASALNRGEALVTIIPDTQLGMSSGPLEIPESLAKKLIRHQSISFREAMTEALEGKAIGAIFSAQTFALVAAVRKISQEQGIEYTDAVLSSISAALSLVESGATAKLHLLTLRSNGARTLPQDIATSISRARLGAGFFGAAGSAVDAVLAFSRYQHASRSGDERSATAYFLASVFYGGSAASTALGSAFTYAAFHAGGSLSGFSVPAVAMLGAWLVGVGIVLAIAAFGAMLYAVHFKYHQMDIFLDRSYWGRGLRAEGKFGQVTRDQLNLIQQDRQANHDAKLFSLKQISDLGMNSEIESIAGLAAGLQIECEWAKGPFTAESINFKISAKAWPLKNNIDVVFDLFPQEGSPPTTALRAHHVLKESRRNDDGCFEWEKSLPLNEDEIGRHRRARVSFVIWGEKPQDVLMRDQIYLRPD